MDELKNLKLATFLFFKIIYCSAFLFVIAKIKSALILPTSSTVVLQCI